MMYILRTLFIFLLFFRVFIAQGQQHPAVVAELSSFVKKANRFNYSYPQEKVYLHMDNTGYYLGETLWFKAYVMTTPHYQPTTHSRVLYVELLAPEGYVVETRKLKITDGQCHGEFHLDSSLYSGYFEIRAYTRMMLNFGDEKIEMQDEKLSMYSALFNPEAPVIFSRVFPVYEKPLEAGDYTKKYMRPREWIRRGHIVTVKKKAEIEPLLRLTFFPEGGHLVQGLMSRIAFKATDRAGRDVQLRGAICEKNGDTVTLFNTEHRGMGSFLLCPENKQYRAIVYAGGKNYHFDLPPVLPEGYVLEVNNLLDKELLVRIAQSGKQNADTLGLAVCCRGQVYSFSVIPLTPGDLQTLKISKDRLAGGVNELFLYNRDGEIAAERKIFIPETRLNNINIRSSYRNGIIHTPHEHITLDFEVSDAAGCPVETTFSLAVRDSTSEELTYNTDDIATSLLLSSEIRGFIPDAHYYFESDDITRRQELDLLLQVQGWSRYPWERMCGRIPFEVKHPIEKGILIDGVLYSIRKNAGGNSLKEKEFVSIDEKNINDIPIRLKLLQDTLSYRGSCMTDENGHFNFEIDSLRGKWSLLLSISDSVKRKKIILPRFYELALNRCFSPTAKSGSFYEKTRRDLQIPDYMTLNDTLYSNITLDDVEVLEKRPGRIINRPSFRFKAIEELETFWDMGFKGDLGIDSEINFWEYFSCLFYKAQLETGSFKIILNENGEINDNVLFGELWSFIDSVIIHTNYKTRRQYKTQNGIIFSELGLDIEKYNKIPDYVFELKLYPRRHKRISASGIRYTSFQGYSDVKDYYSPDYQNMDLPVKNDFRRTLYWNPNVKTDKAGKASVHFYNNSSCRRLRISAETVTKEGKIGVLTQ